MPEPHRLRPILAATEEQDPSTHPNLFLRNLLEGTGIYKRDNEFNRLVNDVLVSVTSYKTLCPHPKLID